MEELKEAMEVVEELNDKFDPEYSSPTRFEVYTDGSSIIIRFMDMTLWHNQEDERIFSEEINEYENLKGYILRETESKLRGVLSRLFGGQKSDIKRVQNSKGVGHE